MLSRALFGFMVVALVGVSLEAQGQNLPAGRWWLKPAVVRDLSLTEQEINRLDSAFNVRYRELIKLKGSVELARFDLEATLDLDSIDEAGILNKAHRLEKERSELALERFRFILEVRQILGADRFRRLKNAFQMLREKNLEPLRSLQRRTQEPRERE